MREKMLQKCPKADLTRLLDKYKLYMDEELKKDLSRLPEDSLIHRAMDFSVSNGGKRFRPSIILMIGEIFNKKEDVKPAAIAVEYFHTASLIADDLPCMDDALERRSKPAVHVQFNESLALLASYALISEGYLKICHAVQSLATENSSAYKVGIEAIENACYNTGIRGAVYGQYLDIFSKDFSKEAVEKTLEKKTVTLFELPFVMGWLLSTGDSNKISDVKLLAYDFGLAFQLADDLDDYEEDKDKDRQINWAVRFGIEDCKEKLTKHAEGFKNKAKELGVFSSPFEALYSYFLHYLK
jgi:geranylgeranyl diphosphate synthase, type II